MAEMTKFENLAIVLQKPKFPENVGASARACVNMGCPNLIVVSPQNWNMDRAMSLATPKGADVLRQMRVGDNLAEELADFSVVYGTTARTGGWRKGVSTPAHAAPSICEQLSDGERVAIVFGPEDRGLLNDEISICGQLLCIPTMEDASSLNLAQAVLVMLYECFKYKPGKPFRPTGSLKSRLATHDEQERLYTTLHETLLNIEYFRDHNTDYWMLPAKRFLNRVGLRRNEFNLLMGICRKMNWMADRKKEYEQRIQELKAEVEALKNQE